MRIVHVVTALEGGGLERVVVELVRAAGQAGHHGHVICVNRNPLPTSELDAGSYTLLQHQGALSMVRPVVLAQVIGELHPDVVHLHSGVWFKGAYASRLAGVRAIIATDHGRPPPDRWPQRTFDGVAARLVDRVVAVSTPLAAYLRSRLLVPAKSLVVVHNGIRLPPLPGEAEALSTRAALHIPEDALVIGSVGRLQPIKAYDQLINAFANILQRRTSSDASLLLLLVGEGPEQESLERQVAGLGLGGSVRFLGKRDDVASLLPTMDVFVQPSKSEGTSLALLEAMAAGVAVVATAVGGTPDALGPAAGDQLVEPGDQSAMVAAISALLGSPQKRKAVGWAGRKRVEEHYSFESMAEAYHRLYQEIVPDRKQGKPSGANVHASA